jgi:hypothetical protein
LQTTTADPTGDFTLPTVPLVVGANPFTIRITDLAGNSADLARTVARMTPPVLDAIGNRTADEGALLQFTVTATDFDSPLSGLTYSLANGTSGQVPPGAGIDSTTGVFTWTPTGTQGSGSYTFDVVVTDGGDPALSDSETITVTVNEVNQFPVLAPIMPATTATSWDLAAEFGTSNPRPDSTGAPGVWYYLKSSSLMRAPGTYSALPYLEGTAYGIDGLQEWAVGYQISSGFDPRNFVNPSVGKNASGGDRYIGYRSLPFPPYFTYDYQWLGNTVNLQPSGTQLAIVAWRSPITGTVTINGFFSDVDTSDGGNGVAWFVDRGTTNLAQGSFGNGGGEYFGLSNVAFSRDEFLYFVVDPLNGDANSDVTRLHLVIDAATAPGLPVNEEGELITFTAKATDADLPAQNLAFSLATHVDPLTGPSPFPQGATIDPSTGLLTWTPSETQGGADYRFNVRVEDEVQPWIKINRMVDIHVNEVNETPILAPVGNKAIGEFQTLTFTASATDADLPANTLTFSLDNGATGQVPAGAAIDPVIGAFTWTVPSTTGPTIYRFDVVVTDSGSPTRSDRETIEVTVNDAPVTPPSGLVAWWSGDGTTNDLAGGHHGQVQNQAGFSTGMVGQAFTFDGVDDFIRIPDHPSLVLLPASSLEFWFSPSRPITPFDGTAHSMVTTRGGINGIGTANTQGIIEVIGPGPRPISTTNTWAANTWYHVAMTHDGTGYRLYINGQLQGTSTSTESIFRGGNLSLSRDSSLGFPGRLDEISLYNRALSAAEIQAIVEAGPAGKIKPGPASVSSADPALMFSGQGGGGSSEGMNSSPDAVIPMGLTTSLSVQVAPIDDADATPLATVSRPWLSDFVVSSAVLTDDPNRDLAVVLS